MKAYVAAPAKLSAAMGRVSRALARYAPKGVEIVKDVNQADVVLLHTIGFPETEENVARLVAAGKQFVIAQYCLRSTQKPKVQDWLPLWQQAEFVWSYYDLCQASREDGVDLLDPTIKDFGFYYSPLGVDPYMFTPPRSENRPFTILTSGYVAESEGVNECVEATKRLGKSLFHLGPSGVAVGPHVTNGFNISDEELAMRYGQSQFVAGLRRCEGFEMPAAEGLLCGARPVMFDRPHYRAWFEEFAEFVPEKAGAFVVQALERTFAAGARPVTPQERLSAVKQFSWDRIAGDFWRLLRRTM